MNLISLTADEILDLIFEKKIANGIVNIESKHSYLSILSKLDERLSNGKISRSQDSVFCRQFASEDRRSREQSVASCRNQLPKKMHAHV